MFKSTKYLKFTVLCMSVLAIMGTTAITPILGLLAIEFPDISPTMIKMIVTLPSIEIMFICLLAGWLATKISKKKLIIISIILYTVGGLGGGLANSYYTLLGFRIILGIGIGLIMPLVASVITDLFDGDERSKMLGLSTAICTFGGVIATIASGMLSTISWRYSFLVYTIAILVLIVTIFGLPETKKETLTKGDSESKNKKIKLPKTIYLFALLGLILTTATVFLTTGLAMFIEVEGIGNSSKAGLTIASFFFGSIITGGLFSKIYKVTKKYSMLFVMICYCLGFWIVSYSNNMALLFIGAIIIGLGYGFINPYLIFNAGLIVPAFANAVAISIISSSFYLGQFLSPFAFSAIGLISGNKTIRFGFKATAILFTIGIVIKTLMIITASKSDNKQAVVKN